GCSSSQIDRIRLLSSVAVLALLAQPSSPLIAPAVAQTATGQESQTLPQVVVAQPKARPKRQAPRPKGQPAAQPLPQPTPVVTPTATAVTTPLNTNTVAESASRLGLTPRETPATVEIIDKQ